LPSQPKPLTQFTFYFRRVSLGILVANAFARYIAGNFVQFERQRQALLTVICW
jgi:hypothetical protein